MAHTLTDVEAAELIVAGASATDLVRLAFPNADQDFALWFLWEQTPYPLVQGVHDLTDYITKRFTDGPRCGEILRDHYCRNRVPVWGRLCWRHREGSF